MNNLIPIIKHRGYDVKEFSRQVLGLSYRTFKRQVDEGGVKYNDIVKILDVLSIDFKDLAGSSILSAKNVDIRKKNPYEKKTEQEFGELYGKLLKKPYNKQLLMSILGGEKYMTLKQFCIKYNIKIDTSSK